MHYIHEQGDGKDEGLCLIALLIGISVCKLFSSTGSIALLAITRSKSSILIFSATWQYTMDLHGGIRPFNSSLRTYTNYTDTNQSFFNSSEDNLAIFY